MSAESLAGVDELPPVGHATEFQRTILEADVALFASLSGDRNPHHLDENFVRDTRFEKRLVHGAFLIGLISAGLTDLTGPGYVYLGQEVRFKNPVFIGDTVTVRATVSKRREDKPIISVDTVVERADGVAAVTGNAGLMRYV